MSTLHLVGVPIGNTEDITLRAVNTLKAVDVIAAEDTRKAARLLSTLGIKPKHLLAHGAHNEHASVAGLLKMLQEGKSIAFISDSGMPAVSDPGFLLARTALEAGIPLNVVPGVSASLTALVGSGLPADAFCFVGFLPRTEQAMKNELVRLKSYPETLIFYESPRRTLKTLKILRESLGNRKAALCRELTKIHEEYLRAPLAEIHQILAERQEVLGEIVIVVEGAGRGAVGDVNPETSEQLKAFIKEGLAKGLSVKDVALQVVQTFSMPKRAAYALCQQVKDETPGVV